MAENKTSDGRGNYGNPEQHAQAGRKGGEATASTHGREFYEEIGEMGGESSGGKFKAGDERTIQAARKGGESSGANRKNQTN